MSLTNDRDYSQNGEQKVILNYFGNYVGNLLSIGENDGITFSNSRAFIERGWKATLVEPSPMAFGVLKSLYKNDGGIQLLNVAIGPEYKVVDFYESGSLISPKDFALVSTVIPKEKERWRHTKFETVQVQQITVADLLRYFDESDWPIDFISIDAEGMDYHILCNIPFTYIGTKCVCVEWNSIEQDKYDAIMKKQHFSLIHKNAENLIYAK